MDIRELRWEVANEALGMWRFRWFALVAAWVIALAGWTATLFIPDEFRSSARVYVDTDTVLAPLLRGLAVQPDTIDQVDLMTRALTARPQLEAVVSKVGIATGAITPIEYERLLNRIEQRISIVKSRRDSIYQISFTHSDPELATDIVQTLLEAFMENSLQKDRSEAVQAQRFLEDQIAVYEVRLEEAEQRLADFKRKNVGLMPGQGGGYYQRLANAEASVRSLEAQIDSAKERSRTLQAQLSGEAPALPLISRTLDSDDQPLDVTIKAFEQELSDLLLRYTEKHPEVVSARETLADLYRAREQQQDAVLNPQSAQGGGGGSMNPVYQELRITLSDNEVEIASLQAKLREEQRNLTYLRSMVDTIPKVEAELNKLDRDYGVVQTQYQTLLGRLESAKLAEEVQSDSESVTFDVIDPPRVPIFPIGPDRELLSFVVLVGALAAGIGLTFLLSKNSPVYFTVPSLSKAVTVPVYGLIAALPAPGRIRRTVFFVLCSVALLVPFVLVSTRTNQIVALLEAARSSISL